MMNRTALALGAAGLLFLAACGSDDGSSDSDSVTVTGAPGSETTEGADPAPEEAPETTEAQEAPATTEAEEAPATTEAEEAPATTEAAPSGPLASIAGSGFVTYDASGETWANLGALVQNETDEDLFGVEVTFNILAADGTPVDTSSSYIQVLPAGAAIPTAGRSVTDLTAALPVSIEVTTFPDEGNFEMNWAELEITVEPAFVVPEIGLPTVSGTLTNTTDKPTEFYQAACLVRSPDGTVLGAIEPYADTAAPGQTVAWEVYGSGDFDAFIALGGTIGECSAIAELR